MVEEGIPFCPACNTPLIRVRVAPRYSTAAAAQDGMEYPAGPTPPPPPPHPVTPALADRQINWPQAWRSAIVPGVLIAVSVAIPLLPPLIMVPASGALAAILYARRLPVLMSPALGARLGGLGGCAGWLGLLAIGLAGGRQSIAWLRQLIEKAAASNPAGSEQVLSMLNTPEGMAAFVVFFLLILLIFLPAFGALGGAAGGALVRHRQNKNSGS